MAAVGLRRGEATALKGKTGKREVAFVMLVFLAVIAWKAAAVDPVGVLTLLVWPVTMWAAAAFGVDALVKQAGMRIGGQDGAEHR